jgi:hypothetical protein
MIDDTDPAPQGGGAPAPEPAATPAPVTDGAATEPETTTTTETATEPETEHQKQSRGDRRIAALSARLAAQAAELEQLRRGGQPQQRQGEPQLTPEQQAYLDQRVAQEVARKTTEERAKAFHEQGRTQYPDWVERCSSLMDMGADAQLAEMLVELPDGAKIAGSLADNPEELERIAGLKSERARAIALGKYAATLAPTRRSAAANVTRAPAPVRAIGNAPSRAEFNEYTASADELAEYYAKKDMDARRRN